MSTTNPTTPAEIKATLTTAHKNLCLILSQLNTTLPIVRSVCSTNGQAATRHKAAADIRERLAEIESDVRRTLAALELPPHTVLGKTLDVNA